MKLYFIKKEKRKNYENVIEWKIYHWVCEMTFHPQPWNFVTGYKIWCLQHDNKFYAFFIYNVDIFKLSLYYTLYN